MKRLFLSLTALLALTAVTAQEAAWESLFDGKSLKGWKPMGGKATYRVEKGVIVGETAPNTPNTFLCTEREFGNFNLEFEFLVDAGLNSGVMFRAVFADGLVRGNQYEIDPDKTTLYQAEPQNTDAEGNLVPAGTQPRSWTGGVYDEKRKGWIGDLTLNPEARAAFKPGKWNKGRVEAYKDGVRTYINGVLAASVVDYETPNGFIGLQVHAVPQFRKMQVRFRNIRIQDLGLNDPATAEVPDPRIGEWSDGSGTVVQSCFDKTENVYKLWVRKEGYRHVAPTAVLTACGGEDGMRYANGEGWSASMEGKQFVVTGPDGFRFEGRKSGRKSPTLGAVAPEGAVVLFNGRDLDQWGAVKHKEWLTWSYEAAEKAKLTPAGDIELMPGNQSLVTKRRFGDIKRLHVEFRLLGDVTNGGLYYMSRWEFNIKDSWCSTKGDPCCAVGNLDGVEQPAWNWALPPMVWQTMDIEYTAPKLAEDGSVVENARATMYHNGRLVYKDLEMGPVRGAGGGRTPITDRGPIYLQEHGTAYQFRNIWIVE